MLFSYKWLQEYIQDLPSPDKLSELLTFGAFEIESVEDKKDDHVIDIDVLPNRAHDCFSHRGIAREIAALCGGKVSMDPLQKENTLPPESNMLEVSIEDSRKCLRYSAVVLRGVSVGPSPEWLRNRLAVLGQKSVNNIVDATNYVMLNIGQPLHAFDMDKMTEKSGGYSISVRNAKKEEKITTLDGEDYTLQESVLLIVDGNSDEPIGIAGIKGGKNSGIDEKTTNIIIESANFDSATVRRASQKLKLRTDASVRFEHKISSTLTEYGIHEIIDLITKVAGGEVDGSVDVYPEVVTVRPVSVSIHSINNLLGTSLEVQTVTDILTRLNMKVEHVEGELVVTPPFERLDICLAEDVIEEVGRVYGYEKVESIVPSEFSKPVQADKTYYYIEKTREFFVKKGFSEVYTYTFQDAGDIEVENPIVADKAYLRKNLSGGLKTSLIVNKRNAPLLGLDKINIFEIGTVFVNREERTHLGIASSQEKSIQNILDLLSQELGVSCSANIENGIAELNFDKLIESLPNPESYDTSYDSVKNLRDISYKQISLYPFVLRDISVWVPESVSSDTVLDTIKNNSGDLLSTSTLFDEYKKDGKTSYAFRLVFQSQEKTLSDDEVTSIVERVTSKLNSTEGWEVR
tara:strand:- start:37866 stop:39761 length:1896 start_codon:yes stop_codon:yes gene_type:complete